jgi:outer membrane protein assembly factor BamC
VKRTSHLFRPASVVALLAAATLSGCGWLGGDSGMFRDRGDDYRRATLDKPLEVPAGLSRDAIEDQLVVPRAQAQVALEGEFEVPRPETINPAAAAERVKLQKLGEQSWILVESVPGEVWPRVRQFLTVNQLAIARLDGAAGVIETAWLQPASTTARERYRFRIEQGVQRGSSEVFLLQADASAGEAAWPAQSSSAAREVEMLKALAQFIADNGSSGSVSMLAQRGISAQGKVFFERKPGQPSQLRLQLPVERAWASLEAAVPRAGFAVAETNRAERELWVRYDPPIVEEDERGFLARIWDWMFSGDDDTDVLDDRETVYVVNLRTAADGASQTIGIARQDGGELSNAAREKLLNLIKGNLT